MHLEEKGNTLNLKMRREFKVKGEPSFHLGTRRPWLIGFIDKEYSQKVWSTPMQMILDSCTPMDRPDKMWQEKDNFLARYPFAATWPEDKYKYTAKKLQLGGDYTISTQKYSMQSKLGVEVRAKLPFEVNWDKQFGVVIGLDSFKGKKTAVVIAMWWPEAMGGAKWVFHSYLID